MRRNRILQLLNDNRESQGRKFNVVQSGDDEATVWLYDYIVSDDGYWGGVSQQAFVREVASITASRIRLRVNSPGGDVFAARAMEAVLREHPAHVTASIDGLAASAASFLCMAADEIEIAPGAFIMVHNAWTVIWGNKADLRKEADLLDKIDGSLVSTYADRTGQTPEQISAWMDAETWLTADESVEHGFADRKVDAGTNATASTAWNLRAYANAPRALNIEPPPPVIQVPKNVVVPDFSAMRRRVDMTTRI